MQSRRRVALVTGASRGIGKAIALRLAGDGHDIAVNYVEEAGRDNAAEVEVVAKQARETGVEAICVEADVTDRKTVADMVERVTARLGAVHVLVNNAGITADRTVRKMAPEEWDRVIAVNLTGAFNCTRAVIEQMAERGWGRIVSISSVVALMGNFGQANYAASKAGIIGMTKSLARELARKGVTVNAVAPGFIDTEMTRAIPDDILGRIVESIPMGELGAAEDVAGAVAFLASDDARYVTGHVLSVNGGLRM
ncbi:MAG: 3-oxoacyl-[acyl-carrier-protein] reductase [Armatimonadota bacterium]